MSLAGHRAAGSVLGHVCNVGVRSNTLPLNHGISMALSTVSALPPSTEMGTKSKPSLCRLRLTTCENFQKESQTVEGMPIHEDNPITNTVLQVLVNKQTSTSSSDIHLLRGESNHSSHNLLC